MAEGNTPFRMQEHYPDCLNGAVTDMVARERHQPCGANNPIAAYWCVSSDAPLRDPHNLAEGFVAAHLRFQTTEAADAAFQVYEESNHYGAAAKECLRISRPTPIIIELAVRQPDHGVATRVLVTHTGMWVPWTLNIPTPKDHPVAALLKHVWSGPSRVTLLSEWTVLGRIILDVKTRRDLSEGSVTEDWVLQETPYHQCGCKWDPVGKSRMAGGWMIPKLCQYDGTKRPLDCPAYGSVLTLSPDLRGFEMLVNDMQRFGLRETDITFLRRNGISGIPIWGCPRMIDHAVTHVQAVPRTLSDLAAQAAAADPSKHALMRQLPGIPRLVQSKLNSASAGGWKRYERVPAKSYPADRVTELADIEP